MTYRPGPIPEPPKDNIYGRELASRLRLEFLTISKFIRPSQTSGIAVSGYGEQTQITTGGTTVRLRSPLANYIVLFRCVDSSGSGVGVDLTNFTSEGFLATPLSDSTLHWTPIPI